MQNRRLTEGSPGNEAPSYPSEIKSKKPRSNKSCRQGETTQKQKERTVQRNCNTGGSGAGKEREQEPVMAGGSGGGR